MVTLHCRCPKHTLSLSGNLVLLGHQRIPSRYREAGMKEWSQAGAGRWRGETEGGKGKGQRWGELETRQWQSKVRAFDSCQLKPRENFTDDLNPAFSFYRGETITHGWWLTQGQNCWFEARTEIWVSWCLLRALSSQHTSASHSQGMGDQGSDEQRRTQAAMKKPLQSLLPQHHVLTESTEEAGEIRPLVTTLLLMKPFGLLIGFTGLDMYGDSLFLSQKEVWLDQAQAWQFMAWKPTAQEVCTPYIPGPPPASMGCGTWKEITTGQLAFLISWPWREHNCGEYTGWG